MAYNCWSNKCAQKPELRITGFHIPHPTHFCPICKRAYWIHTIEHKDAKNKIVFTEYHIKDVPFNKTNWGAKPASYYLDTYDYWWRELENKEKYEELERAKKKAEEENENAGSYY